jgi:hypothetical protein
MFIIVSVRAGAERRPCRPVISLSLWLVWGCLYKIFRHKLCVQSPAPPLSAGKLVGQMPFVTLTVYHLETRVRVAKCKRDG